MKKLSVEKCENLIGGRAFSKALTIDGQKLVVQGQCNEGGNSFANFKIGQGNGNAASVLHMSCGLGDVCFYTVFNALFILDCELNGSPGIYVFF